MGKSRRQRGSVSISHVSIIVVVGLTASAGLFSLGTAMDEAVQGEAAAAAASPVGGSSQAGSGYPGADYPGADYPGAGEPGAGEPGAGGDGDGPTAEVGGAGHAGSGGDLDGANGETGQPVSGDGHSDAPHGEASVGVISGVDGPRAEASVGFISSVDTGHAVPPNSEDGGWFSGLMGSVSNAIEDARERALSTILSRIGDVLSGVFGGIFGSFTSLIPGLAAEEGGSRYYDRLFPGDLEPPEYHTLPWFPGMEPPEYRTLPGYPDLPFWTWPHPSNEGYPGAETEIERVEGAIARAATARAEEHRINAYTGEDASVDWEAGDGHPLTNIPTSPVSTEDTPNFLDASDVQRVEGDYRYDSEEMEIEGSFRGNGDTMQLQLRVYHGGEAYDVTIDNVEFGANLDEVVRRELRLRGEGESRWDETISTDNGERIELDHFRDTGADGATEGGMDGTWNLEGGHEVEIYGDSNQDGSYRVHVDQFYRAEMAEAVYVPASPPVRGGNIPR